MKLSYNLFGLVTTAIPAFAALATTTVCCNFGLGKYLIVMHVLIAI